MVNVICSLCIANRLFLLCLNIYINVYMYTYIHIRIHVQTLLVFINILFMPLASSIKRISKQNTYNQKHIQFIAKFIINTAINKWEHETEWECEREWVRERRSERGQAGIRYVWVMEDLLQSFSALFCYFLYPTHTHIYTLSNTHIHTHIIKSQLSHNVHAPQ